jgi:outer membrane protein assembly factor BamE
MRMFRPLSAPLFLAVALAACSSGPRIPGITPYRMEIQQGNFVSQEMVSQLKAGMSKEQVRLALGTPLLTDLFHADRWDYVYYREGSNGKRESRKMAVFFADGKLLRVDGDVTMAKEQPEKEPPAKEAK